MVYRVVKAALVTLGFSQSIAPIERVGRIQMVTETIIRYVDVREDEAALVDLYSHLLAEGTAHEQTIVVAISGCRLSERREVHILEYVALYALLVRQQVAQLVDVFYFMVGAVHGVSFLIVWLKVGVGWLFLNVKQGSCNGVKPYFDVLLLGEE